ncbi:MAG: AAA family ATPase [Verrucomicrobiota bacterium]|jgi:MoxR-like ATPase
MPALIYKFQDRQCRVPLKDRTTIGRLEDNDVCVPSGSISSHHAVITRNGEGFQLEDAGSSNGIVVNGRRASSVALQQGLVFALGDVDFIFVNDEVEVAPAPEAVSTPVAAAPAPEAVIARFKDARERVLEEIGKTIIGQREVLNQILVAMFARGHCLLIGVPGLAKTLMVKTLGQAVNLQSRRIQFTPDLMPSDITGTDILEEDSATGKRAFRFHRGPIFANLLLADEINRTPPKTQAALLEAMQEHRVTISGTTYDLPEPFMVLATQNPIEQEGTYPLPEAQLDRFMFCVNLGYPSAAEEQQVILDTTRDVPSSAAQVLDAAAVLELQRHVRQMPVSQHVALYALSLIRATRPNAGGAPDFVNRWVRWGAGTRAGQYLLLAAKAHVLLQGRFSVSCADVRQYALPVLRHRIFPNFTAASEGVDTDQIVKKILEAVKEPDYGK